jgi:hypothetical protein
VSRIRVGDIEIDGHRVRIGTTSDAPGHAHSVLSAQSVPYGSRPLGPAPLPRANYAFLNAIPLSAGFIVLAGCIASAVGILAAVLTWPRDGIADYVLHGTFLIPLGLGVALIGWLKAVHQDSLNKIDADAADETTEEYIAELGALLRHEDRSHTVEWVQRELGWRPADVVTTLAWLRERGELREEIDVDSGHYYYVATTPPARDLDARLRSTNRMT